MPAEYGLIGYPLGHSFSPEYFAKKFAAQHIDAVYSAYPLETIDELPALLEAHDFRGLNITIPYKEAALQYLDAVDETVKKVGAANTISFKNGIKTGHNTDVTGFEQSIIPLLKPHHKQALILGTGGASKAVAYVLEKLGIIYLKISRSKKPGTLWYDELGPEIIKAHPLIINCSPVGKAPEAKYAPSIPYEGITNNHLLYDLIYNPAETKFLSIGKQHGAAIKNGREMLELQADAAWEIWNS